MTGGLTQQLAEERFASFDTSSPLEYNLFLCLRKGK